MAFIIDTYNAMDAWDTSHAIYLFRVNGICYAIKEVELEWGLPVLPLRIDDDKRPQDFHLYATEQEAKQFVQLVRSYN